MENEFLPARVDAKLGGNSITMFEIRMSFLKLQIWASYFHAHLSYSNRKLVWYVEKGNRLQYKDRTNRAFSQVYSVSTPYIIMGENLKLMNHYYNNTEYRRYNAITVKTTTHISQDTLAPII